MPEIVYHDLEDELDAIRLSLYEEIKDMTPEEEVTYIKAETEPIMRQFGLKRSTLTPVIPYKRQRMPQTD